MCKALSGSSRALFPGARALRQPNFNCRTFPCRGYERGHAQRLLLAPAQDAPDTGGRPTLAGLGWLLQAIHDAVLDHFYDCLVHAQAAVHLGAEDLACASPEEVVWQEFLPGEEYDLNLFVERDGSVPAAVVLRKTGLKDGLVGNALGVERVERPDVADLGVRAARSLGLEGPIDLDALCDMMRKLVDCNH